MRHCFPFFALALTACGVFGSSDSDSPSEPAPTDGADAAAAPDISGDGANSIFVSSSLGRAKTEGADGTLTHPFKSLADAFAAAKIEKKRVVACGETYEEAVVLVDGVTAFGNYDCSVVPWINSARHAIIKSPTSPAVTAENISQPTRLDGFDVTSPDFDTQPPGDVAPTSTALVIRSSASVTIANALIRAGKGGVGANGTEGTANVETGKAAGDAIWQGQGCTGILCPLYTQKSGAAGGTSTCAAGQPGGVGGGGGPGWWLVNGTPKAQPSTHGLPLSTTAETKVGGGDGEDGQPGGAGADATDGSNGVYVMASTGFVPGDGTAGGIGSPGQGGGGGGGRIGWINDEMKYYSPNPPPSYLWGTAGAGGGAGGCGGVPGTAGKGGGASIGALVVASDVTFDHVRLESSSGGQGGQGTLGTDGLKGGKGGAPYNNGNLVFYVSYGSGGGAGGQGGSSGLSGHGATGPSIALAFAGQEPKLVESILQPGPAGAGHAALTKKTLATTKTLAATTGDSIAKLEVH